MRPQSQISNGRLYLHWTDSGSITRSYPVETGADGLDYVVIQDHDEAADIRDAIAPGAELHCYGSWEPRALLLGDVSMLVPAEVCE